MRDQLGERWRENSVDLPRPVRAAALLSILAAAIWMFRGAFLCFFVQDDFAWLAISRFQSLRDFAACFFRFNGAGNYRPLSQETYFWFGQQLFGLSPAGYHALGLIAHLGAVLLLYLLLRRFFTTAPSLAGTFLYAVHGAHLTSLYWISAFPETLAMVFLLATILLFVRFDRMDDRGAYALSIAAMLFGVLSKESILSLPLILAAYCLLLARARLLWTLPYFGISAACILFRAAGNVSLSPYALSFGRTTLENLLAYLSWMAGLSESFVRSNLHWEPASGYRWIAILFLVLLAFLLIISRNRRVAGFSLLWMAFALQPVLYFSNHIYPYYLAPALAGLSMLVAAALPALRSCSDWRRWLPALFVAAAAAGLSCHTIRLDGDWWIRRTDARRAFVDRLLWMDRRMSGNGTAYIFGLVSEDLENLENGTVFKAYDLEPRRLQFLFPELDYDLPARLHRLAQSGEIDKAYCFVFGAEGIVDQTAAFRKNPEKLPPH